MTLMTVMVLVCASLSTVIGVIAWRTGARLGVWHHVLYAATIGAVATSLVLAPSAALWIAAIGLFAIAFTRRGSAVHRLTGAFIWISCVLYALLQRF
jgi:hypothetical protein